MAETKQKNTASVKLKKSAPIASKKTINLAFHESSFNAKKMMPIIGIVVLCVLVFLKVGFLDQNEKRTKALNELAQKQEMLAVLQTKLTGYDELANNYGRYSYGWMTLEESSLVDRMDVLEIMEDLVDPSASIENMAVNSNVVNISISGLSLEKTSSLVNTLEAHPLIRSVTVSAARSEDAELNASVSMIIILEKEDSSNG